MNIEKLIRYAENELMNEVFNNEEDMWGVFDQIFIDGEWYFEDEQNDGKIQMFTLCSEDYEEQIYFEFIINDDGSVEVLDIEECLEW